VTTRSVVLAQTSPVAPAPLAAPVWGCQGWLQRQALGAAPLHSRCSTTRQGHDCQAGATQWCSGPCG
jgi:hypothetical protein